MMETAPTPFGGGVRDDDDDFFGGGGGTTCRRSHPKAWTPYATKEAIRRECLQRIKSERQKRVWRHRNRSPVEAQARRVLAAVQEEAWMMTPEEEEEIMAELRAELLTFEADAWAEADDDEADHYARQLETEARLLEQEDDVVLCPGCEQGYLAYDAADPSLVHCSECGLRVAVDDGLPHLRTLLAATYDDHAATGCPSKPSFYVDPRVGPFLAARCSECQFCAFLV